MDQLIGIIWDVSKFLCSCCKQEADYVRNLGGNLQSLEEKWANLKAIEEDVKAEIAQVETTGEMRRTQQLQLWLQNVEAIQKKIEDIQVKGAQEISNKCLSECCPKNCISSYKTGKKVAEMLKNVDEVACNGKEYLNKDAVIAHKLPTRQAEEMPLDEPMGMDLMLQKVWNSIDGAENVGVIGLYGMGGVGKTTLLKKLNNEIVSRRQDFEVVMWVVVSKETNFDSIMDKIKNQLGIADSVWNRCSSQEEKAAKIHRFLKQKKFVVLLDDIWEKLELKMVGIPHPKDSNFQSKVLFTTRSENVCAKMQAHKTFKVEILTKKEAFELFCSKVGEETLNSHPGIPKLAEEMAAECKGLPLALNVVGSAMAGVKEFKEWENYKNNLRDSPWIASDYEKSVFSRLKISFDKLPDDAHRNCFLYCALSPEDYEIEVLDLIDKWIGEGFLGEYATKSIYDMRNHGESVIQKLKLSCLLESVEDDYFLWRRVKMHDVIRDMALWLARDQDRNKKKILVQGDVLKVSQDDVETWRIVEKISITNSDEFNVPAVAYPNLTTLLFTSSMAYKEITLDLSSIQYMSKLKVLGLSCGTTLIELPTEIGGLALLEYLLLEGKICASKFPIELKKLGNLKYFYVHVYDTDLARIPLQVVSSLEQLRVLRFSTTAKRESGEEREFLEKLECLPNLEELRMQIHTDDGLSKLLESTKLQTCMWFLRLSDIGTQINMPSLLASMSKMKHLHYIAFSRLKFVKDSCSDICDTAFCRLSMLRHVQIHNCSSITDLTWLKYAPLLQYLRIFKCESLEEVIKDGGIGREIENMDNLFSSLEHLRLFYLPNLKSLYKTALCLPSIRHIVIDRCPKLKGLPFDPNSPKDKLRLIKGNQGWWDNLVQEDPTIKDKFQSKFKVI